MALLDYLLGKKKKSASVAKERLQIILAREHVPKGSPNFLPALKKDILEVVGRYVAIDHDNIHVTLENDGKLEILELNITIPDIESCEVVQKVVQKIKSEA
jgi:cell division topological specificity factor